MDKLEEVAKRCKDAGAPSCEILQLDQADPASIDKLAEETLMRLGGAPDVLVNNAGVSQGGADLLTGDPDGWDTTVDINLMGPMRLTRRIAPAMAKRGSGVIINTGSMAGTKPMEKNVHYAASKWGIRGWTLGTYEELRKHGIKTMVIEPGFVATDMTVHQEGVNPDLMIRQEDMAAAALLPFKMSATGLPLEVVLKLAKSPYKAED
ncbi:hypothetical protein N2152v2_010844 [Parachlorella kessleri]